MFFYVFSVYGLYTAIFTHLCELVICTWVWKLILVGIHMDANVCMRYVYILAFYSLGKGLWAV